MIDYKVDDFDIKRLGSFYTKDKTIFRVFAPETEQLYLVINSKKYEMHKNHFYFEIALGGDLEKVKYCYVNDNGICFKDPFSYYSDEHYSYVLDTNKFIKDKVIPEEIKDTIIYEASVRDFSCTNSYTGKNKRKLLAFSEDGLILDGCKIGLDYLKDLGITHLQLLPIFAFDLDKAEYNWGYNPIAYNYVHKDYINESDNPYAYINEPRYVVNKLHENNIRVTLDVVFNHVYEHTKFDLEKMLPGHVFRYKADGSLAEGSFCGNEIKSEDIFIREYLCEMSQRYIELFDIDGIRIDQMGILDCDCVNAILDKCKAVKQDFILYGEGWNMGDVLDINKRAALINADKIKNVKMFNDYFRDTMINYCSGNDALKNEVKQILSGNSNNMQYNQTINYVECHDDYTFFDRISKFKDEEPMWMNVRRCILALSLVMISRGTPFIHAGEEFLRTKKLNRNSYNSNESINKIDWNRRVEYNDVCEYLKDLISIRKDNDEFTKQNVIVSFEDYYECLIYHLDDLKIIINPCMWDHIYNDGKLYHVLLDANGKCDKMCDVLSVPAFSILIYR